MNGDEKQKKERKKETTRKKLGSLRSYEIRRGRGRSCWVKADKKFASRAKRKERKKRKRKEKCAYMCEQTLPRLAQVILTATMHDVGIRCVDLGLVALPTALYFQLYLVSFVRGTCMLRLCCRFHRQEVVSVVVIFKVEVARDFYVTKQRISTSWGVFRLLGCSRRASSTALWLLTVACAWIASPRGIKLSLRTCHSNSVSFLFTQTFPEKSLSSPIMPCSRASFNVRNRAFLTTACRIVDRSMDPVVPTAKGQVPRDEACRSLPMSTLFGRLPNAVTSS